jgi:salicylate hydroxylase
MQEGGEGIDDLLVPSRRAVLARRENGVPQHRDHGAHGGGHERGVAGKRAAPVAHVLQVVGQVAGLGGEALPGAAEFADGSFSSADLLVGADGLWSATRSILDPDAPRPAYAGLYSVSGVAEGVPGVAGEPAMFTMVFARNGAFIHLPAPDGTVWWSAQVIAPQQPEFAGVGEQEWLDRLAALYRLERRPLSIIEATIRLHRPALMHVLAEVPTWHDDRIVLVGDAAHPVGAGQGASMAIEDAVVLAQALAREGSTAAALAAYDRLRRARVGKMVKAAAANRDAKKAGPIGRRLGDLFMPVFFRLFFERATSWLYTHDLGTLPEVTEGAAR